MSAYGGWSQPVGATLYLEEEMECMGWVKDFIEGYCGREYGVMGSLEARRVAEGDRASRPLRLPVEGGDPGRATPRKLCTGYWPFSIEKKSSALSIA
jgi:hypothetical protein